MPVARSFHKIVQARARRDAGFRRELLINAVEALIDDEHEVAYRLLDHYLSGVTYLEELSNVLLISSRNIRGLFNCEVNPGGVGMIAAINEMLRREGLELKILRRTTFSRQRVS